MKIRVLSKAEQMYTYYWSMQICAQTGFIGYLRGDFGRTGNEFYTSWTDGYAKWKTDEMKAAFDTVINKLREDKGLLHSLSSMAAFVEKHPDSAFEGNYCTEYGFRVDTYSYAFLFRCNLTKGDYNFYCYCYVKEWLNGHIRKAAKGIRFVDTNYNEKFRIPDGGKIIIHYAWGENEERTCRFIDEYHTEIGSNLYHICEFAERMEQNGHTYEPKPDEAPKES